MTKFMNRKGLALGAAFALISTGLVAAPASAAGEISLAVNGGTGTSTILGESFSLKATVGSLVPDSSNDEVTFLVENATGATLTYTADAGTPGVATGGTPVQGAEGTSVDGTGTATTASSAVTSVAVKGVFTPASGGTTNTAATFEDNQTVAISSAATTAHSVTVTAWLDADGSGTINNSEFASSPVTVSFVEADDAGLTVAIDAQLGDANYVASVTSSVINVAQVNVANLSVQTGIYVSGTATAISAGFTYGVYTTGGDNTSRGEAVVLDSTTKASLDTASTAVTFNDGSPRSALTAGSYVSQVIYSADGGTAVWAVVSPVLAFGVGAATVDATESTSEVVAVAGSVLATGEVRKGYTGNVTVSVEALTALEAPVAGAVVRLTVASVAGTIKLGGATVTAKDYSATTDANGIATFVFSSAAALASDAVGIGAIKSQGVTITADGADLNWNASTWTAVETTVGATDQTADLTHAADVGSTSVLSFKVVDQFGAAFADAAYRMKAAVTGRTVATSYDDLSDGVATFSVADAALTTTATPATVALSYEKLASGVWSANTDITALNNRLINFYSQTNSVAITETSVSARAALKAAKAVDVRTGTATVFDTAGANSNEQATINGTVKNSVTSAAQAGALITVSGDSSLLFNVNDVYAFGSLTFFDADGAYAVNIFSNKAQTDSVVTVTSADGGSDTVKVSFAGVATNAGTSLVITAPASIAPSSTLTATMTLTDVYGNAVDTNISATDWNDDSDTTDAGETATNFAVSITGPGFSLATTPTETDAAGSASIARLLGANESGTIVITVSYDQNDDGDYLDATDLVVSKSIVVGTAGNVGALSSWTKNLNDGTVKMYAKNIVGAGKVQFMLNGEEIAWVRATSAADSKLRSANGASYLVRTVDLVEGQKNVLEIYVDGVRTTRTAYTY